MKPTVLGDAEITIEDKNREIVVVTDSSINSFDDQVIQMMASNKKERARLSSRDLLRRNLIFSSQTDLK